MVGQPHGVSRPCFPCGFNSLQFPLRPAFPLCLPRLFSGAEDVDEISLRLGCERQLRGSAATHPNHAPVYSTLQRIRPAC
ncbi:hypothetical protein CHELA40_40139 [Chelatococcus asaccharovorans]|nr:hypothetical protein CHELA17_50054 [Chelatococcus asaccharovorans]CAH1689970.1 hypothetical protein CHELA40_40139 [Chelatococcus asaccharovorans]